MMLTNLWTCCLFRCLPPPAAHSTADNPGVLFFKRTLLTKPPRLNPSQGSLAEAPEERRRLGPGGPGRGGRLAAGVQRGPGEPAQRGGGGPLRDGAGEGLPPGDGQDEGGGGQALPQRPADLQGPAAPQGESSTSGPPTPQGESSTPQSESSTSG